MFSFIFELEKIIFTFFSTINVSFKIYGLTFVEIYLYEIFVTSFFIFIIRNNELRKFNNYIFFSNKMFNSNY